MALERTAWQQPVSAGAISERGKLQVWTHITIGSFFCPASATSAQHADAAVMIAVMSALTGTTVACFWGSEKNISFDIRSLISLPTTNNTIPLQLQDAVGRTEY